MITNSREEHDTRIVLVQYSNTYHDLGGAWFSKLDWMAEAIAGIRRYSQRQWHLFILKFIMMRIVGKG